MNLDQFIGGQQEFHPVALSDLDLLKAHGAVLYGKLDGPLARRVGGGFAGLVGAQNGEQRAQRHENQQHQDKGSARGASHGGYRLWPVPR
jgi:hypothetical protein